MTALVPARPAGRQRPLDAFNRAALTDTRPLPNNELRAVTGWLLAIPRSDHTRTAYARDLGQFAGFIAQLDGATLTTATPDHVNAWWQAMKARGLALKSIGRKLSAASSFYAWATEPGGPLAHLTRNPAAPTRARRTPKLAGRRTPALSAAQLQAVVSACPDQATRALVLLLASTGARISEVLTADRGDWQTRATGHVLSVLGKGDKRRELPLPAPVVDALTALGARARPASAPLLVDRTGRRLAYGQATYQLEVAGQLAGLDRTLRPHQLRASYATRARLDHGADMGDIADQLGHASTEMTQIYVREARVAAIGADLNERMAQAILGR